MGRRRAVSAFVQFQPILDALKGGGVSSAK
jgi:hypothetical protein